MVLRKKTGSNNPVLQGTRKQNIKTKYTSSLAEGKIARGRDVNQHN